MQKVTIGIQFNFKMLIIFMWFFIYINHKAQRLNFETSNIGDAKKVTLTSNKTQNEKLCLCD